MLTWTLACLKCKASPLSILSLLKISEPAETAGSWYALEMSFLLHYPLKTSSLYRQDFTRPAWLPACFTMVQLGWQVSCKELDQKSANCCLAHPPSSCHRCRGPIRLWSICSWPLRAKHRFNWLSELLCFKGPTVTAQALLSYCTALGSRILLTAENKFAVLYRARRSIFSEF